MSRVDLVAGLALAGALLAACGPPSLGSNSPAGPTAQATLVAATAPQSAPGGGAARPMVFGDFAEPNVLNPILAPDTANRLFHLLFESLVRPDPKTGAPIPALAETWDQSADGLTYTVHLKPNLKWSDGQPLTAEDARFTFDTIRDPNIPSPARSFYTQVSAIEALDPLTLRVTLKTASCSFLLQGLGIGILPKHVLGTSADFVKDEFNQKPTVGSGAFVFKDRQQGDHINLVANPYYWAGKPKFDQWIYKIVPNTTALAAQLKTGEVDQAVIQPDALDDLQQAGLNIKSYFGRNFDYVGYNLTRPLFQDKRVRQALSYGLDRTQIVQAVLFGQGQVINSPIPIISWAATDAVPTYAYDLGKARELLGQAGWATDQDGILRRDGVPFQFALATISGGKVREDDMTIAQSQLTKLGIQVKTETLEANTFFDRVKVAHDFDAIVNTVTQDPDPDQSALWLSSEYPKGQNFIGYTNPEVDQLLKQAAAAPGCGQTARKPLYERFQQVIADDQPFTFLYVRKTLLAVNKQVQGVDPSAWAGTEWNIQDWQVSR